MVVEIVLQYIRIRRQHLNHGLGESFHVALPDFRILAFQLLEHLKALGQLGEDVHNAVGKVGVLRVLLELKYVKKKY